MDDVPSRQRLLLEAEILGRTGAWEMDMVTGEVASTEGNRRLFFGEDPSKGQRFEDYATAVHPDDRDWVLRRRQALLEGHGDPDIEFRVVWPDGSIHTIVGRQLVIRDADDKPLRTMGFNADVTELRAAQQKLMAADRLISIGTMAAGVAHEINNPLAYVLANVEFALERGGAGLGPDVLQVVEALREAREGTDHVRTIVRDLKTFTRPDERTKGSIDVLRVLDSCLHMVSNQLEVRARIVKSYGAIPRVVANEARLGQVFLNLLINAAQAIPEGNQAHNEVRVTTSTDAGGHVVVAIRDTGAGMTPEVKERLFEPFFTTKPIGEGTGLGLAISRNIVTDMGGRIVVESEPGKGTELRVVLPPTEEAPKAVAATTVERGGRRGEILIIDDEPRMLTTMRRTLSGEHHVTVAATAKEALALIEQGKSFDVILCDLMMPEMTGMALYRKLEHERPEIARRMVFITGGAFTPGAREFLASVPNATFEKPFSSDELRRFLQRKLTSG